MSVRTTRHERVALALRRPHLTFGNHSPITHPRAAVARRPGFARLGKNPTSTLTHLNIAPRTLERAFRTRRKIVHTRQRRRIALLHRRTLRLHHKLPPGTHLDRIGITHFGALFALHNIRIPFVRVITRSRKATHQTATQK